MIQVDLRMTNEGARLAMDELDEFRKWLSPRMKRVKADGPTRSYVIFTALKKKLEQAVELQDRREAERRKAERPEPPTVKEVRKP